MIPLEYDILKPIVLGYTRYDLLEIQDLQVLLGYDLLMVGFHYSITVWFPYSIVLLRCDTIISWSLIRCDS